MKISLENYLRNKIDEVESMHSYELATDTIRCWIDEYNEQLRQYNVVGSASQLVDCAVCDYRHDKTERIEKKSKVWTTYHCPKCGSESTCRVS